MTHKKRQGRSTACPAHNPIMGVKIMDALTIDELHDTIVDAIANIVIDKIAQWLWDDVGAAIDDTFTPSVRHQIWQQIAEQLDELTNNVRLYAQQLVQSP
jgi:hypothetical protein